LDSIRSAFNSARASLSKRIENALHYRRLRWAVADDSACDQVDSQLDLMRWTYDHLPARDSETYVYIARSIKSSIQRCERARLALQALRVETDLKQEKLNSALAEIERKTAWIRRRSARIQRNFDAECQKIGQAEKELTTRIEEKFRDMIREKWEGTRNAQIRSDERRMEAMISMRNLRKVRRDLVALKKLALPHPSIGLEAKLRVSRIVLSNLTEENENLRNAVDQMKSAVSGGSAQSVSD
jgi:hypothetical protein